jgi:hypothetical protein
LSIVEPVQKMEYTVLMRVHLKMGHGGTMGSEPIFEMIGLGPGLKDQFPGRVENPRED